MIRKNLSDFAEIVEQWHPTLNNGLEPKDFSYSSNQKAWFKCKANHVWKSQICEITRKNRKSVCPFCSGKKLCKTNNLAVSYPDVAKEWHPTLNKETPYEVFPKATKSVFWQCLENKEHVWKTRVSHRTVGNSKCPFCSGRKLCKTNSLTTVFPNIAKEWHPSLNGDLKPSDVISGARKKVFWQCSNDVEHIWSASISDRVKKRGNGSGCPLCRESRGEKAIRTYLNKNNIDYIRQFQFIKSEIPLNKFDFKIESNLFNGLIEFQGEQHYVPVDFSSKGKQLEAFAKYVKNDIKKEIFCLKHNIKLIHIPYWEIDNIEKIMDDLLKNKTPSTSHPPKKVLDFNNLRHIIQSGCIEKFYRGRDFKPLLY